MSGWRMAAKCLYRLGGTATSAQLSVPLTFDASPAMSRLYALGLVRCHHKAGPASIWKMTPLGEAWCEGRVIELAAPRHKGQQGKQTRFQATWLSSLPRDVRITEPA